MRMARRQGWAVQGPEAELRIMDLVRRAMGSHSRLKTRGGSCLMSLVPVVDEKNKCVHLREDYVS